MHLRQDTKKVKVGNIYIGKDSPVSIQSMLNVKASDFKGNIEQALRLEQAGCEIIRVSVPNKETVNLITELKQNVKVPIVADIHFDYKLAVMSVEAGADKVRINPGNIGSSDNVKEVVKACRKHNVPIRIGVNSGSIEKDLLHKYGVSSKALFESARRHIQILENLDFYDIVLSLKASDVNMMYNAYKIAAEECDYPLHLGVTEAGTERMGTIRSAAGIGGLLLLGIGNTIRVSLTDDPVKEVLAAKDILAATGVRTEGIKIVSCPTCGRTSIDLISLANSVEKALSSVQKNLTVAVMGCVVNGPGEASAADIGIAGGNKEGLIFKKGKIICKLPENELLPRLLEEIEKMD